MYEFIRIWNSSQCLLNVYFRLCDKYFIVSLCCPQEENISNFNLAFKGPGDLVTASSSNLISHTSHTGHQPHWPFNAPSMFQPKSLCLALSFQHQIFKWLPFLSSESFPTTESQLTTLALLLCYHMVLLGFLPPVDYNLMRTIDLS